MRWCHAPHVDPRSTDAVLWTKRSQISEQEEPVIVKDTCDPSLPEWADAACAIGRVRVLPLHRSRNTGERVWIETWGPGTESVVIQPHGGEEIFVISGTLIDDGVCYGERSWIRNPIGSTGKRWTRWAPAGCKLLIKSGHLPMVSELYRRARQGEQFSSSVAQYSQAERIHGDPHGRDHARRAREASLRTDRIYQARSSARPPALPRAVGS